MIEDSQEYLQHWEKENNPFYPKEMRWDRVKINRFLKDYKEQLILPIVINHRELLIAFHKWQQKMWTSSNAEITESVVDVFLKIN